MRYNSIMRWLIRSPLHFFLSQSILLMTYPGHRSGKIYATPMSYLDINGLLWINSTRERTWWRNLGGGSDVTLRLRGRGMPARAEAIDDLRLVQVALQKLFRAAPGNARFFQVRLDDGGESLETDLQQAAAARVVVRASPVH